MIKKPMLAEKIEDLSSLKYPVLVTPKLDGIRCLIVNGKAVTRSFKVIPNTFIRNRLEATCPNGFDGEIVTNSKNGIIQPFNLISSAVMSEDGEPNFTYVVFDFYNYEGESYCFRMDRLSVQTKIDSVEYLMPKEVNDESELLTYETETLSKGYEGVMIRSANGPYKFGRSTVKEGYLLKLKRFYDSEAIILDFQEKMHNGNEASVDAFGYAERSSHQVNQTPMNTLGAFLVKDAKTGVEFKIGTGDGLDDKLRKTIWDNKGKYLGNLIKYKAQKCGEKDAPRFPKFVGFRDERDL